MNAISGRIQSFEFAVSKQMNSIGLEKNISSKETFASLSLEIDVATGEDNVTDHMNETNQSIAADERDFNNNNKEVKDHNRHNTFSMFFEESPEKRTNTNNSTATATATHSSEDSDSGGEINSNKGNLSRATRAGLKVCLSGWLGLTLIWLLACLLFFFTPSSCQIAKLVVSIDF